jgi:hypothetical protein
MLPAVGNRHYISPRCPDGLSIWEKPVKKPVEGEANAVSEQQHSEDAAAVLMVVQRLLKLLTEKNIISHHEAKIVAQGGGNRLKDRLAVLEGVISPDGGS